MMSVYGCKTKKDLKAKVGQDAQPVFMETSAFGPEYTPNGRFAVVGPSPDQRKWFAEVHTKDGKIVKVS